MSTLTANHNLPIEPKQTHIVFKILVVLSMMTLMGSTLTGVMTYINTGFTDTFFTTWLSAFTLAALTVMPAGFTLMILLSKTVEKLAPNLTEKKKNLIVGICMALIMESSLALTTTINTLGANNIWTDASLLPSTEFLAIWINAVIHALPVALTLMVIVSATIKPKIERFLKS